jgi:hypothetical protein
MRVLLIALFSLSVFATEEVTVASYSNGSFKCTIKKYVDETIMGKDSHSIYKSRVMPKIGVSWNKYELATINGLQSKAFEMIGDADVSIDLPKEFDVHIYNKAGTRFSLLDFQTEEASVLASVIVDLCKR